jgi:hypothetical protein
MNWEQQFGSLPHDTQMWTLLGTRRYEAWVKQGRPAYSQFVEPLKALDRVWPPIPRPVETENGNLGR